MALRTAPFLASLALFTSACVVGMDGDPVDDNGDEAAFTGSGVPANDLRWDSFTNSCTESVRHSIAVSGGSLTAIFDTGSSVKKCTVTGVLRVPPGVKITSVAQQVRTDGDASPVMYTATLGGTSVASTRFAAYAGRDLTASVASLGSALCARGDQSTRTVTFSMTLSTSAADVSLDSIDWFVDAARCP